MQTLCKEQEGRVNLYKHQTKQHKGGCEKCLCDILPWVHRSDSSVMLTCFTVTVTFLRKNALLKANVSESSSDWLPINPATKTKEKAPLLNFVCAVFLCRCYHYCHCHFDFCYQYQYSYRRRHHHVTVKAKDIVKVMDTVTEAVTITDAVAIIATST